MIEPVVIREGDRPTHVVIPWAEWQRLRALVEDAEDAALALAIARDPATGWTPAAVLDRILEQGEHPVKAWREHRGLSQAALAARAAVPQPTIARIESRARKGTLVQMKRLAGALGVSLDTLTATLD
jgi:ribosome-binding protein aMBF1 (putative translation factor)